MACLWLLVVVVTGLLSARTRQQTQVRPTDKSVLQQTTAVNVGRASGGGQRPSTHAPPQVGTESGSLWEVQHQLEQENVTTQDDENFQQVEDSGCQATALARLSVALCASPFEQQMATLEADARCLLHDVLGAYNQLSVCLERLSHWCGCHYPNAAAHSAFLRVHSAFFGRCPPRPPQERHLEDAPRRLLLGLTLVPVALVPLLVYAVARRAPSAEQ